PHELAIRDLTITLQTLQSHGFSVNQKRVSLNHLPNITFRGIIDTELDLEFTTITTSMLVSGWRAHCRDKVTQGIWNANDIKHNISWLALRIVHLVSRNLRQIRAVLILTG
ncbi:hypothetical protein E2320_009740, partial [Naja naja]